MTPEMYLMIGLAVGLASLMLTLFVVAMQVMSARFAEMNAQMSARFAEMNAEVNARFAEMNAQMIQIREEQVRLANEIAEVKQRVTALETWAASLNEQVTRFQMLVDRLLRLPQEPNVRHGE